MSTKESFMKELMELADWHYKEQVHSCPSAFVSGPEAAYKAGVIMGYIIRQGEETTGVLIDPEEPLTHDWEEDDD